MRAFVAALVLGASAACLAAEAPTVLLVGDSTMAPQTGYGDALCQRLEPAAACLNLARGGRSTLSYRAEGLWARVLARVRAGAPGVPHHVLVQFGHNDQPGKPGRSTDLVSEYPANLSRYVDELRAAGGLPVLVTPLVRRTFKGGELHNDLLPWADAMRRVAEAKQVPLIDLNALSGAAVQAMGARQADLLAQGPPGSASFDHTHLGARGACVFASLVSQALGEQVQALRVSGPAPDCEAIEPAAVDTLAPRLNRATSDEAGWAVGTMGGQGGRVMRVTTLASQGPGSLRAALEARGPRLVVFEVGGVIDMRGERLVARHPFITLAGQTAPRPGITLVKGEFIIDTHDVIVQHLMFRPGAYGRAKRSGADHDGISTAGRAHHVIVDHCSLSWATDENLSISGPRFNGATPTDWRLNTSHHITYSHNLIYEGLGDSVHTKGEHSKGTLVHDNASGVLLLGNVYAANRERNALFKGGVHAAMVNNLIVGPGARAVHYNLVAHEWVGQPHETGRVALVGNVLRHGNDTPAGTPLFTLGGQGDVELHLHDNLAVDANGQPVSEVGRYTAGPARVLTATTPYLPPRVRVVPAEQLEAQILLSAGARAWDRDPIDFKLLSDVAEGRTRLIDDETQSSGLPRYKPTRQRFDAALWNLRDMSPKAGWEAWFAPRATASPPSAPAR